MGLLWGFQVPRGGWAGCAGGCSCPLGWATADSGLRVLLETAWPLCFYWCVLLLHISVQCGHWCVVVVCTGGCGGASPSCVPVFGVCWVYSGLCWWGLVSVDAVVFRCGWFGRSWVGLGAAL